MTLLIKYIRKDGSNGVGNFELDSKYTNIDHQLINNVLNAIAQTNIYDSLEYIGYR